MRTAVIVAVVLGLGWGTGLAHTARSVPVGPDDLATLLEARTNLEVQCVLSYYYLLEGCPYVTVLDGIGENETYGVHFNMTDVVAWHPPCDTAACLTLDTIELVLYDVLASPANDMNIRIYGADADGRPVGDLLGNRDFTPLFTQPGEFTTVVIDFTNAGAVDGLDLSPCRGNFVALLTWKNPSGHPLLVLDNISTPVTNCPGTEACCDMGAVPYVYPRPATRTYFYGTEFAWAKQDSIADSGGEATYGYLEAFWSAAFCKWSAATVPTTWGSIKAMYR
jgi:hypothetical protein